MSERNKTCLKLIFTKTSSKTEAAKINDFWKFIDSQNEIQPYVVEKNSDNHKSFKNKDRTLASEKDDNEEKFWYNELLLFKALGLDKIALSTCKYKKAFKKQNEQLILSDMVEQTNEEINDELKKFETRLNNKESI